MRLAASSSLAVGIALLATTLAVGTVLVPRTAAQAPAIDAAALYKKHCIICHGATGTSPLPNAAFADGIWVHGPTLKEVSATITGGVKGTVMQPFAAKLSEAEIAALAKYVRAFDKKLK
jgi:mono/diheme cytochrome c family protein